ncbi:hypothetical protein NQ317_010000 [Molorchus minor]|uniref:SUI1 domain-containing protein n=1 Tax=Molorchus minor TaxID=1323400 RepID=A0ABQ9K6S9_9CUCU|nr:hypothetical protein NQ317_010000 [Molorchus minor]
MFKKTFKIKSNTQVKGSERKNFKDLLLKSFPNLIDEEINNFLPKKDILNSIKIVTHDELVVHVYTIQKRAMIFDVKGCIFPTVYFLWNFPKILYAFTTHQQVMNNISSGADLMLPGVMTPPTQSGLSKYGNIAENNIVCVNLSNNQAAVAVGVASQSSASMAMANGRGKCVIIHHYYGDNLCMLEDLPLLPIPQLGPPEWLTMKSFDDDFPPLGKSNTSDVNTIGMNTNETAKEVKDENVNAEGPIEEDAVVETVEDMDNLLNYCFLGAIKYSKAVLPILTSNFYKLHMLALSVKIDRKKDTASGEVATDVTESYIITQNVLPLFQPEGYQKGDTIGSSNIRKFVTKYVKENNLQDEDNSRLVKPRNILSTICKTENAITWEELMEKVCASMKNCYTVKTGSEEIVNKGKVSPITMTVSVRSGNKKVTLVDNLELFGIRLADFAKECQHGVAASTSISRPPGKKCDQLLVQGNQVLFIYNLLIEKYKVPKKVYTGS